MSGDSMEAKAQDLNVAESKSLKRDHDSMDDFEHLEHDSSPIQDTTHQAPAEQQKQQQQQQQQSALFGQQLTDVPRVDNLIDISKSFETNFMKSSAFPEESDLRPVPATPPPSADFEKCEAMAHSSDPFQRPLDQALRAEMGDPKGATMAFMESERSSAPVHQATPKDEMECEVRSSASAAGAGDANLTKRDEVKSDAITVESTASTGLTAIDPLVCDAKKSHGDSSSTTTLSNLPDSRPDDFGKVSEGSAAKSREEDLLGEADLISTKEVRQNEPDMSVFSSTTSNAPGLDERKDSKEIRDDFLGEIRSSVLPAPQKSPTIDFLGEDASMKDDKSKNIMDDDSWNVVERPDSGHEKLEEFVPEPPTKPLPPLPKEANLESDKSSNPDKFEMSNDFIVAEGTRGKSQQQQQQQRQQQQSGSETGDSEFESEAEPSPAKTARPVRHEPSEPESKIYCRRPCSKADDIEIAPKEIFRDLNLDAWFNPERLNPKVAALIYWRDPKKSGIVFGTILGVLLSLAYFSLISVLAYCSLVVLMVTGSFRIYKSLLQAVQKTTDGHPFKDVLDLDLTLPAEKVHEVADVAVAHANAMVAELRRVFLVEDFVDSFKFGVLMWCLTYVGSLFNGMTLVIMGVVALFTLPKLYETNKVQIDQNLALVHGKVNELTTKLKAVIPLGKKAEPIKEE